MFQDSVNVLPRGSVEQQNVAKPFTSHFRHFRFDPVYRLDDETAARISLAPLHAAGVHERLLDQPVVAAALTQRLQAVEVAVAEVTVDVGLHLKRLFKRFRKYQV